MTAVVSNVTPGIYPTTFGMFCPCSKQTYRKLKRIRLLMETATRRNSVWTRWNNKLPKNRVIRKGPNKGQLIPEPRLFDRFFQKEPLPRHTWETWLGEGQRTHRIVETSDYDLFMADYLNARQPKATPEQVRPLKMSDEQIDALLLEMEAWYKGE